MSETYRKIPESVRGISLKDKLEMRRYRPVMQAADEAWERIGPLVPTWNKPASPEHDIVPPQGLEGFHKLVWGPDNYHLVHQLVSGGRLASTTIKRFGEKLEIVDSADVNGVHTYTELVFNGKQYRGGYSWLNREIVKAPDSAVLSRIITTFTPWKEPSEHVIAKGMIGQVTIPMPSKNRSF